MTPQEILDRLAAYEAVLTDKHFVFTSGLHSPAYVNVRAASHDSEFMSELGFDIAERLDQFNPEVIVGPETLGRTLAGFTAIHSELAKTGIWCDIVTEAGVKQAVFSPKLDFGRLITPGMNVAIVDDLLTTGGSIKLTADLVRSLGGVVVAAAAVARRERNVTAESCGVPALEVLVEIEEFSTFTEEECMIAGPCSKQVKMVLRPGHGHEWIENNPDYPTA